VIGSDPFEFGVALRLLADGLPAFALLLIACGLGRLGAPWTRAALPLGVAAAALLLLALGQGQWGVDRVLPWRALAAVAAAAAAGRVATTFLSWRACMAQLHRKVAALEQEVAARAAAEGAPAQLPRMAAIAEIAGGIAHDFNNLLTVVMANLELLDTRLEATSPLRRYVGRAMAGAERGAALTRRLLAFARRAPLRPEPFDAAAHVRAAADRLRAVLGPGIALEFDTDAAGAWIETDRAQLDSALLNLVTNAREAMPEGGRVTVSVHLATWDADARAADGAAPPPGAYVAIAITDDGTGMTEQVRRAAFDPFFTTRPAGHGSGLGLSQVYAFVRQSHGHVVLRSAPGAGTTVTLWLRRFPRD
jgi:signal transduction histidine kinase